MLRWRHSLRFLFCRVKLFSHVLGGAFQHGIGEGTGADRRGVQWPGDAPRGICFTAWASTMPFLPWSLALQHNGSFLPSIQLHDGTSGTSFPGSSNRVSQVLKSPSKWLLMGPILMVMVAISAFSGAVFVSSEESYPFSQHTARSQSAPFRGECLIFILSAALVRRTVA